MMKMVYYLEATNEVLETLARIQRTGLGKVTIEPIEMGCIEVTIEINVATISKHIENILAPFV